MEALLKPVSATYPLRQYSPYDERSKMLNCYLARDSLCFTARRRILMSYPHDIHRKWNVKKSFKPSALVSNEGDIEKLPHEKYISANNELSSKHVDGYPNIHLKKLETLYHFCRPYAMMGIQMVTLSVAFLPVGSIVDLSPTFFVGLLQIMALQALNHIYIVALNQLFDVEIDKINKEYLPLASGELSTRDIMAVSFLAIILSIGLVIMSKSPALLGVLVANFIYGTGYSADLPFLRWKRHPLLAVASTVFVCAFGVHIFTFIHIQKYVLGRPNLITKSIIFQTTMMCFYSLAGVILKDVPDMDGDRENGIDTLSIRFGQKRAFAIGLNVLYASVGFGMVVGASSSLWFGKIIVVLGNLALGLIFWQWSRQTDPTNKSSAQSFYQLAIWKLLSIASLLTHFVR
ncbi:hypothetical protein NE237_032680 [Protea cynaroides]|uniref:Uncharacterized protein n=1 Tax=Protea cynaroides TaxID=273540 RepID=A0A9Q0L3G9_9MAGN|nr:hypothetical protein NE237_032680 [Protea cynaroides]